MPKSQAAFALAAATEVVKFCGRGDLLILSDQESAVKALVDQLAAAAGILMIKDSGIPAVFVEGIVASGSGRLQDILRDPAEDLFR